MSKLDDIMVWLTAGIFLHEREVIAKNDIKSLMLEIIGADENFDEDGGVSRYKDGVDQWGKEYANNRNNVIGGRRMLRAELRKKVEKL